MVCANEEKTQSCKRGNERQKDVNERIGFILVNDISGKRSLIRE
jgi:hypothetical protein